jgi:hypothetical protein
LFIWVSQENPLNVEVLKIPNSVGDQPPRPR